MKHEKYSNIFNPRSLEGGGGGGGGGRGGQIDPPPSIFLALNFCSLTPILSKALAQLFLVWEHIF